VAGCRLSPSDVKNESPQFIDPLRQKIIQIDIEPRNAGWVYPIEVSLASDLKIILRQIIDTLNLLTGGKFTGAKKRLDALKKVKAAGSHFTAPELLADTSPILPQRVVSEIEKAVDEKTLITLDAGNNRLWMAHFFKSKAAGSVFCPGGVAGMGWGPPAALAVKILHPGSPVLSVSGDGGFAMVTYVLSMAVQYKLPVAFVVMNNSVLGMVRDTQRGRTIASEFVETDFAQIARAFGCQGIRVQKPSELAPAIRKALSASAPTVIDVVTSPEEPYSKISS
jgi:acetolactate synthase-1/2/3 large subunit